MQAVLGRAGRASTQVHHCPIPELPWEYSRRSGSESHPQQQSRRKPLTRQVSNIPARRDIYEPLFGDFINHVTSPNYKQGHFPGESEEAYSARLAIELDAKIQQLGPEKVIAFVAEPVVGSALGVMPPPKGYFPAIEAVIKKYGLLLAMDEVMSGSGRVGELFAHQAVAEGVKPDITALAKGLGGGYVPISAILVNARIAAVIRKAGWWKSTHTYQNHPICCAAALKVMQIIERDGLLANVRERGAELRKALMAGLAGCRRVLDIRGAGLVIMIWETHREGPS